LDGGTSPSPFSLAAAVDIPSARSPRSQLPICRILRTGLFNAPDLRRNRAAKETLSKEVGYPATVIAWDVTTRGQHTMVGCLELKRAEARW